MIKKYLSVKQAALQLRENERQVRRLCESGKLAGAKFIDGQWQIPADADPRFKPYLVLGNRVDEQFQSVPKNKRDEALRRVGLIQDFEKFSGQTVRSGGKRTQAMQVFCCEKKIAFPSFKRWIKKYRVNGVMGLVDTRGGDPVKREIISPDAWEYFKSIYLDPRRPSIKACYNVLEFVNKKDGYDWIIPGYDQLCRYVEKNIPKNVEILYREGMAAYTEKCAPYVMVDPNSVEPGQVWLSDHHKFDCWIQHRGQWVRPWITAWQDYRSRKIVGWHISTNPNSTTILHAMKPAVKQFGPPESVKIDNGRDYDSQLFTGMTKAQRRGEYLNEDDKKMIQGIYGLLEIDVSFAIPYSPQSKKVERWFATVCDQFTKTIPTYCGPDSARRPENLAEYMKTEKAVEEAYTLETFSVLVGRYIELYNASSHSGSGMEGRSPDQVFYSRATKRVVNEQSLDFLMQVWSSVLKVGKNGVRFKGIYYGQYDSTLLSYFGKEVRVGYDPCDVTKVSVVEAKTYKFICIAEAAKLVPYGKIGEESLREAMAQKKRALRFVKQQKQSRHAVLTSIEDMAILAEHDKQKQDDKASIIKPVRTVLDGQVKEVLRQKNIQKVKQAAGAESLNTVPDLHLDFESPERSKPDIIKLDFF